MAAPDPDHLIDQADRLIGLRRSGKPRQTDLRRAISSAYYALFHEVATAAADDFVGKSRRTSPRYQLVYRSMNHKHVWEVCKAVPERPGKKVPDNYAPYVPALAPVSFDQELALFAEVFKESYKLRQLADYDPHYRVSASEARAAVTEAREALARFRTADSAWREWFLSMVVIRPR